MLNHQNPGSPRVAKIGRLRCPFLVGIRKISGSGQQFQAELDDARVTCPEDLSALFTEATGFEELCG